MDQVQKAQYRTIFGRNPNDFPNDGFGVVVAHQLPTIGQHDFKWVKAETIGVEYAHYGFRLHPKANPVNVHVFGNARTIQQLACTRKYAVCELELVLKTTPTTREFVLVNLYLTEPTRKVTHGFSVISVQKNHVSGVYTTKDMRGVGIAVSSR